MKVSSNFKLANDSARVKDGDLEKVVSACFLNNIEREDFTVRAYDKTETRLALNRIQWFAELSDWQKYDSVKVFFLIAMAETNVKLLQDSSLNESEAVKRFFEGFSQQDKNDLTKDFFRMSHSLKKMYLGFDEIVCILLNVRHQVVHGKNHYSFKFYRGNQNFITGVIGSKKMKKDVTYNLELTYDAFKHLMIKSAIENVRKAL